MTSRYRKLLDIHQNKSTKPSRSKYQEVLDNHRESKANKRAFREKGKSSSYSRFIAANGHNIHKLKAKDSTGRWAYYFVYVRRSRDSQFVKALKSNETVDLESFGRVIGSCYGERPSESLIKELEEKYGFEI